MKHEIRVQSTITIDDMIVQDVIQSGVDQDPGRIILLRQVMNTLDAQVREALIRMGWTPPENPTNGARQ